MIDARIFSFKKFALPKASSITDITTDIAVGYFDNIEVNSIDVDNRYYSTIDKFLVGYFRKLHSTSTEELSKQNLFAFTNIDSRECFEDDKYFFDSKKLNDFWKNNKSDVNRFYSLLHINISSRKDIFTLLKQLNFVFNGENAQSYNAVFYFSFDYSDVIICAKNMSVNDYTHKIFEVNYWNKTSDTNIAIIKDSFTLLALNNSLIKETFNIIENNPNDDYEQIQVIINDNLNNNNTKILTEKLNVVYNIGVQDFEIFEKFLNEIKNRNIPFENYYMLGRHDATICSSETNLMWLIMLLYYVDKYSSISQIIPSDKSLFNCESFIRVAFNATDISNKYNGFYAYKQNEIYWKRYKKAKKNLHDKLNQLIQNFSKTNYIKENHISALNAFSDSITGTLKNGFADDFIVCVYEPFVSFLDYIDKKINCKDGDYQEDFNQLYNQFFEVVSSLVNSAMHSDRQFIQTPSFNPVFYDVPPKLMAFYTVLTSYIKELNKDNDEYTYSFVFKPSFSNNIAVLPYSYNESPPADRLLAVLINEESLYRPSHVINVMHHEVTHYVGDLQRARKQRKEYWTKLILFIVFKSTLFFENNEQFLKNHKFESLLNKLIIDIFDVIKQQLFYEKHSGFSENFQLYTYELFKCIYTDPKIDTIINNFFRYNFLNIDFVEYTKKVKEALFLLSKFIPDNRKTKYTSNFYITRIFSKWYQIIVSVFSESYADIQMILLSDLNYSDYIRNLVVYENMKFSNFIQPETFYRIFSVAYTLHVLGYWNVKYCTEDIVDLSDTDKKECKKIMLAIEHLIEWQKSHYYTSTKDSMHFQNGCFSLFTQTDVFEKKDWDFISDKEPYLVEIFSNYLVDVFNKTQNHYDKFEISQKRDFLQQTIQKLKNFNDAADVFYLVQDINEKYLNSLIGISSDDIKE